jgi:hypothetical protein
MKELGTAITGSASAILDRLVTYLPSVFGAVLLLFAGWFLGRLLRALTVRGAVLAETLLARFVAPRAAEKLRFGRSAAVLGTVVFWVVLLFFVTAATQVLGLQTFTDWLARLLEYIPTFAAGLLIIAVGYIVSGFVGDLTHAAATRLAPSQRTMLARVAQGAILAAAILVGAEQVGIRITFLAIIAGAVFMTVAGGVAIAMSLGARGYVSNLIGAHYLRQAFEVGQRVRVAGHEGRILEVTTTGLLLEVDGGRVLLPGRIFHDEAIVLLAPEHANG